jgi:hypothetical protein
MPWFNEFSSINGCRFSNNDIKHNLQLYFECSLSHLALFLEIYYQQVEMLWPYYHFRLHILYPTRILLMDLVFDSKPKKIHSYFVHAFFKDFQLFAIISKQMDAYLILSRESAIPVLHRKLTPSLEEWALEELLFTSSKVRISSVLFGSALVNFLRIEGPERCLSWVLELLIR